VYRKKRETKEGEKEVCGSNAGKMETSQGAAALHNN